MVKFRHRSLLFHVAVSSASYRVRRTEDDEMKEMIPRTWLPLLLLLGLSTHGPNGALAVEVTPSSKCSSLCLNNIQDNPALKEPSSTQEWDLVCDDRELDGPNSTVRGRRWKDCLTCQTTSTERDSRTNENDVYWFLCAFSTSSRSENDGSGERLMRKWIRS